MAVGKDVYELKCNISIILDTGVKLCGNVGKTPTMYCEICLFESKADKFIHYR